MALADKIAIIVLLIIYLGMSVVVIIMHLQFAETVYDVGYVKSNNLHGPLMLGGIISMGVALFIFRIFRGSKTRNIKYIHFMFHTIAGALFVTGYCFKDNYKESYITAQHAFFNSTKTQPNRVLHLTSFAHVTSGYLFLGCFAIQYLVAVFIFVYMYQNKKMRLYYAPFHDIIGIWLFLCYVGTYLTGVYFLYESHIGFLPGSDADRAHDEMHILTIPTYFCFLIVLGVILSPYFEWELVGPL